MGTFTNELQEWAQKQDQSKTKRQDSAAVAFLATKEDVIEAMEAGYSLRTIWQYLKEKGRITSSYETFRRHTKRFITAPKLTPVSTVSKVPETNTTDSASNNKADNATVITQSENKGFSMNPTPNLEDLI